MLGSRDLHHLDSHEDLASHFDARLTCQLLVAVLTCGVILNQSLWRRPTPMPSPLKFLRTSSAKSKSGTLTRIKERTTFDHAARISHFICPQSRYILSRRYSPCCSPASDAARSGYTFGRVGALPFSGRVILTRVSARYRVLFAAKQSIRILHIEIGR